VLSAGHDPVLVYSRPEDRFAEMNTQALPFGILPTFCPDPPAHLQLLSGDLILLAQTASSNGRATGVSNSVCLEWKG
jgi:phosphoserine phosphatase RsbU/P